MKNKREIVFITGNKGKLEEAKQIIPQIKNKNIDLPEIQELNSKKIIEAKLKEAYRHHKGEYIVEDTSVYFDSLNGLPGPLIKWFLEALGDGGTAELALKYKNKKAKAKTMIGYINDNGGIKYFSGEVSGRIVKPRGGNGFGWDKIFVPDGYKKTYGQMSKEEKNKISMRKIALSKLAKYLKI